MSNPIPPLLCNTPPPIDFEDGNDDDDFEDFEAAKTEYEGVSLPASLQLKMKNIEENLDLPPLPNDLEYSLYSEKTTSGFKSIEKIENEELKNVKENTEKINDSLTEIRDTFKETPTSELDTEIRKAEVHLIKEKLDVQELKTESTGKISREDSPQSLELYTNNLSEDENDSIGEFQAANEVNYDDNTSLPSLKFDSIGVSKSATPIFDDKGLQTKGSDENYKKENSIFSALQSTSSQNDVESTDPELQMQTIDSSSDDAFILESQEVKENPTEDSFSHFKQHCEDKEIVNFSSRGDTLTQSQVQEHILEENELNQQNNFEFEADFSQFESCNISSLPSDNASSNKVNSIQTDLSENIENLDINLEADDDFEEFQDFKTAEIQKNDNDDDFGEFNNFEASFSEDGTLNSFKLISLDEQVKPILNLMFPTMNDNSSVLNEKTENKVHDSNSQFINQLGEIDAAKALEYQWANSNIKQSLIKALGIDSRNILYGEKWNSSLPRFAANLVFNPLEPLKPVKLGDGPSNHISLLSNQQSKKMENTPNTSIRGNVPEVEFDWNSAGLVNPLDGIKKIVRERKTETVHPPESSGLDESIQQQTTEETIPDIKATNTTPSVSNINNDLTNEILEKSQDKVDPSAAVSQASDKLSSTDIMRPPSAPSTFVFPLKETHIFTPSKVEPNDLRNTKSDDKDSIDFDFKMAAAGIIIDEKVVKKEYRDIEYNPTNWNFGSLQETNIDNVCDSSNEQNTESVANSLHTMFIENISAVPPDSKENSKVEDLPEEFSDFHFKLSENNIKSTCPITVENTLETTNYPFQAITQDGQKVLDIFVEKVKIEAESGNLKTSNSVDDDFTEFQSVLPPIVNSIKATSQKLNKSIVEEKSKSRTGTPTFSDEMILSPAVLLPQAIKFNSGPKIEWPEPGINLEELARIEELFPQKKNDKFKEISGDKASSKINVNDDDDDWSDFVSVPAMNQSNLPAVSGVTTGLNSCVSNDDEWSDFVSGTPAQWNNAHPVASPQISNIWNQSTIRNSFNSYTHSQQNLQPKNNVPTKFYQGKNINNNISQYLLHSNSVISDHHQPNQYLPPQQQDQFQQINMLPQQRSQGIVKSQLNQAPSISLIPDLGFVAPRSLINIPRSTISKK